MEINFNEGYIACIDKPLEWTSSDVVRKIKFRLNHNGFRKIKVGHAGTLDPLATGVLIVCIGKATKQVEALQAQVKEYVAELALGATTPSFDREHEIDHTYPTDHITLEKVETAVKSLCGERLQEPPIYSAKKVEGLRAYEIARAGESVELKKSLITIYSIDILEYEQTKIKIKVVCSRGTYIRSLAREIGEALDSGAYLLSLRRTASGEHRVEESMQLEDFLTIIGPGEKRE